jgi:hypothetical protein
VAHRFGKRDLRRQVRHRRHADHPDKAGQARALAFIDEWKGKFAAVNASKLSAKQRTDLAC